jgi:hypothetical protein
VEFALTTLVLMMHVCAPVILIVGWFRWYKAPKQITTQASLSLIAFVLATTSALLALSSMAYSVMRGGFRYYDPTLLNFFRAGLSISLISLVFSIGSVWKPSSLRWFAPALSFSMLVLWAVWVSQE